MPFSWSYYNFSNFNNDSLETTMAARVKYNMRPCLCWVQQALIFSTIFNFKLNKKMFSETKYESIQVKGTEEEK